MEQLTPFPLNCKTLHFGIIESGVVGGRGGVVQMFHLFCPRLYVTWLVLLKETTEVACVIAQWFISF